MKLQIFINNNLKLILLFSCAIWLLFFAIIPPWWHYDESGHLEVAWLYANHPDYILQGIIDNDFRKEMALSMDRFGWYDQIKKGSLQLDSDDPISIGITQFEENPLYYIIASLPLRFLKAQPVLVQYTAVRFISFLFYILILIFAYLTARMLFPQNKLSQVLIPGVMALTPGFVDSMTGINNDTLAALAGTMFFYSAIRLIISENRNWQAWLILIISTALCLLAKTTSAILVPLLLLLILLSVSIPRRVLFSGLAGLILVMGVILFRFDGNYPWFSTPTTNHELIQETSNGYDGKYVLTINTNEKNKDLRFTQCLRTSDVNQAQGSELVLTYLAWAQEESTIRHPRMIFYLNDFEVKVDTIYKKIQTAPQQFTQTILVPRNARGACLVVQPTSGKLPKNTIYFDDFRLNLNLKNGNIELLRNGSFENRGVRFSEFVNKSLTTSKFFDGKAELLLMLFMDPMAFNWAFKWLIERFFYTLWVGLAGTKLITPWSGHQVILNGIMLISLFSNIYLTFRSKRRKISFFILISLLYVFLVILMRGMDGILYGKLYIHSRYFLPALLPFSLLVVIGWDKCIRILNQSRRLSVFLTLIPAIALFLTNYYLLGYAMLQFHPYASKVLLLPTSAWISGGIILLIGIIVTNLYINKRIFPND